MSEKLEKLLDAAMELSLEERAKLAGELLFSLDQPSADELEMLWLEEADRRLKHFRSNKNLGIPAEDVFRRAIADIS